MSFDPLQIIRSKTREEWYALLLDRCTSVRIWVQENGEKASVLALVLGISLVVFFKIFVATLAVFIIIGFTWWNLAPSSKDTQL